MPSNSTTHVIHVPNSHLGPATAHLAHHTGPVIRSRRETVHVLNAHYGLDKLITKPGDVGHLRMLQMLKSARLRSQLEFASTLVAQASRAEAEAAASAAQNDGSSDEELDTKSADSKAGAKSVSIPVARPRNSLFDHMIRRDQQAATGHTKHTSGSTTSLDGGSDDATAGSGAKRGGRLSVYGADRRKSANASAARKYIVPPPPTSSLADSLNEGILDGASDPLELPVPVLHLHNTRIVVAPVTPQTRDAARSAPGGSAGGRSVLTPAVSDWEPQSRRPTPGGNPKSPKEILDTVFALWTKGHGGRNKSRRSVLPVPQVAKFPQPVPEQIDSKRKASVMRQDLASALQRLSAPSSAASLKGSWGTGSKPVTPDSIAASAVVPSDPPPGKRKSVSIGLVLERAPSAEAVPKKPQTAPATSETRRLSSRAFVSSASAATPSNRPARPASVAAPGSKGRQPLPPVPVSTTALDKGKEGKSVVVKQPPSNPGTNDDRRPSHLPSEPVMPAAKKPAQPAVVEITHVPQVTISADAPSPPPIAIEISADEATPIAKQSPPSPLRHGRRMSMFSDAGSNDSIASVLVHPISPVAKSPTKTNHPMRPFPRSPLNAGKLLAQRHGLIQSHSFASEVSPESDVSNPCSRVNSAGIIADEDPPITHTGRRLSIMDALNLPSSRASSASPTNACGRRSSARLPNQRRSRGIANTLPASAYLSLPSRAMYLIGSSSNYSHHRRRRRYKYLLSDLATPLHKSRLAAVTQLADKLGGGKELTAKLVRALCPPDDLLKPISGYFVGTVVTGNLNQYSTNGGPSGPGSANASARTARLLREVAASLSSRHGSASDDKPSRDPFQAIKSRVQAGWSWRERRAMRKAKHLLNGTNRRKHSFYVAVARLAAGHEPKTEIPDVSIEATRRVSMVRTRLGLGSELGSMVFGHVPHKVRPAAMSPDVGKPQPGRPRTGSPKRVVVGENRSLVTKYPQTRERLRADARRLKVNVTRDSSDALHAGRDDKPLSGPGLWFPGALFGQMSEMGL